MIFVKKTLKQHTFFEINFINILDIYFPGLGMIFLFT